MNTYAPLSGCSERARNYLDINWGSFRKREITLRVLEATVVHALVCWDVWQYMDNVTARPLPGKVRPNPLLPNSGVFWHKGGERKLLLCSLGHFSRVLLALFFEGFWHNLLHFTSTGLSTMIPGYATLSLTFQLASSHQDQNVLCALISPRIKRDLTEDPQQRSPHPHGNWKLPSRFVMSLQKNKKEIKFIDYK